MKPLRPLIAITMGDPAGIGPEIIHLALKNEQIYSICRPLVIGDPNILARAAHATQSNLGLSITETPKTGKYTHGNMDVLAVSNLTRQDPPWGKPTPTSAKAMLDYIITATDLTRSQTCDAMVTCPISKIALKTAGVTFPGHTELIAHRTKTADYAMMLAGKKLRVVLVTIHVALNHVAGALTPRHIGRIIRLTHDTLVNRFGIAAPRIAVAGLNPHAGEDGLFGSEEADIITPAIGTARENGWNISGPYPPDTVFVQTLNGAFDAVVCMYHDQGLIPFKLIHFSDGVNTTIGLPIIRTSVDHGTAYDLAGTGTADPGSLTAAIEMAVQQALTVHKKRT